MKEKDLKDGDYIYERHKSWDYYYIIKIGSYTSLKIIDNRSNSFTNLRGCNLGNRDSFIRKATLKERNWLDACIKAGKYVKPSKILEIDNYNMY